MSFEMPPKTGSTPGTLTIDQLKTYSPPASAVARVYTVGRRPNGAVESLADVAVASGKSFWDYIEFLFPGCNRKPECVNWYLRHRYRCGETADGKNRRFVGGEKLPLPKSDWMDARHSSPGADLPPTPLYRRDVGAIIEVVANDPAAREPIDSVLPLLGPLLPAGLVRNLMMIYLESFGRGVKENIHEKAGRYFEDKASDLAWKYACSGIADATSTSLTRNRARVPFLVSAESFDRRGEVTHVATKIVMQRPGCAPTAYVLDWWRTLVVANPKIFEEPEFHSGNFMAGTEYFRFTGFNLPER